MKLVGALVLLLLILSTDSLEVGFYKTNCPASANVEGVIKAVVEAKYKNDKSIVPGLLRMYFHDCFVQGCDASLLLNTGSGNEERDSVPNQSIHGIDVIDAAKLEVEKVCKGVVSCADIIALATRDAVELAGGQHYEVPCGRSDGLVSLKAAADLGLPGPTSSVMDAATLFKARGLDISDMVTLLGAHTVGVSHCVFFRDRLYNGKPGGGPDPNMNPKLVERLIKICPANDNSQLEPTAPKADLDGDTPETIDNVYYKQLQDNSGVLQLDQSLTKDTAANEVVNNLARDSVLFSAQFGQALIKLGNIGSLPIVSPRRSVRLLCTKPNLLS